MGSPTEAELASLEKKLDFEPEYRLLELRTLSHPREIGAVDRYQIGDLARVPRTSGRWSLGVVSEVEPGKSVTVLLRATTGLSTKELDSQLLAKCNPLKIGDFFYLEDKPFWVAGLSDDGEIMVLSRSGQRVDPREVRRMMEDVIHGDAEKTVQISTRNSDRTPPEGRPLSTARPMHSVPYVPIESILEANSQYGLIAGNKETPTVYNLRSPVADAALHTHRGHNYKNWNEDGGALFADSHGRLFVGVFDQAGGEGSDESARGAATAVAGEMLFNEMQKVAATRASRDEAEAALIRAARRAHEAILARGKGEVTTFIGAMIDDEEAVIVNVGDSGTMQFDADGKHRRSTEVQGVGRLLLEGLGMTRKPTFEHHAYRWSVNRGDFFLFGTDGLLDSRLPEAEIGKLLVDAGDAASATRRLRDVVSRRMISREGKPDNLTVLVVKVGDESEQTAPPVPKPPS